MVMVKKKEEKLSTKWKMPATLPRLFLDLCKEGKTLTQISSHVGIPRDVLLKWSTDQFKPDFRRAWILGREACQSYYEAMYQGMITKKVDGDAARIAALGTYLRVQFKESWGEKQEQKIEINHIDRMSVKELDAQILSMLSKKSVKPDLKVVSSDVDSDES